MSSIVWYGTPGRFKQWFSVLITGPNGRGAENWNGDLACNQLLCRVKRWKIEPIIWHVGHCFVGQRGQNLNYDVTCRALLCRAREGEKLYNDFACSQLLCMAEGGDANNESACWSLPAKAGGKFKWSGMLIIGLYACKRERCKQCFGMLITALKRSEGEN